MNQDAGIKDAESGAFSVNYPRFPVKMTVEFATNLRQLHRARSELGKSRSFIPSG